MTSTRTTAWHQEAAAAGFMSIAYVCAESGTRPAPFQKQSLNLDPSKPGP